MRILIAILFCLFYGQVHAQRHDANWLVSSGYLGQGSNTLIHFPSGGGPPQISSTGGTIPFNYSNASISDANGNFLFFTNGIEVFDRNYQVIPGCITQTPYTIQMATLGLNRTNADLFLPWPGDTNKYVLFYCVPEIPLIISGPCPGGHPWLFSHLYYTILDKSLNGGNGGIISANNIAYVDTLIALGGLAAVKHANGRDWWVITKERCSANFNTLLFTANGIQQIFTQACGLPMNNSLYGAVSRFSPDGNTLIVSFDDTLMNLYKFDRCNGTLYDPLLINTSPDGEGYNDFSPNGRFLYRSVAPQGIKTSQYDIDKYYQPGGILNSKRYVDPVVDTGDCGQGVGTASSACHPALAPDGKIYFGQCYTCNLSVVNYPDSLDTLCFMEYNSIQLPMPHSGALPKFPNFKLGPVTGSVCDSLTAIHELLAQDISVYPNPAKDNLFITSSHPLNETVITLYNIHSQILLQQSPGFGNNFELSIPPDLSTGIYMLRIQSKEGVVTKKIVVGR